MNVFVLVLAPERWLQGVGDLTDLKWYAKCGSSYVLPGGKSGELHVQQKDERRRAFVTVGLPFVINRVPAINGIYYKGGAGFYTKLLAFFF